MLKIANPTLELTFDRTTGELQINDRRDPKARQVVGQRHDAAERERVVVHRAAAAGARGDPALHAGGRRVDVAAAGGLTGARAPHPPFGLSPSTGSGQACRSLVPRRHSCSTHRGGKGLCGRGLRRELKRSARWADCPALLVLRAHGKTRYAGCARCACMFWVLGWRASLRHRPRERTACFETSPTPPSNVDKELSGDRTTGATTTDL